MKIIKEGLLALITLMLFTDTINAQTWEEIGFNLPEGDTAYYNTVITFANKDIGWLFTCSNKTNNLFKTTDGGQSWQKVRTLYKNGYYSAAAVFSMEQDFFYMINTDDLLSVGYDARFTTDGGITWDSTEIVNEAFGTVHFFNEENGIAMGLEHCWTTTDRGKTWNKKGKIPLSKDIYFYNEKLGWAVGYSTFMTDAGYIARTTDGGDNWEYQDSTTFGPVDYFGVEFIDSLKGFAIGGSLNKTIDGGNNWLHNLYPDLGGYDIGFLDQKNGWISSSTEIFGTTDGGETWKLQFENTKFYFFRKIIILKKDKVAYVLGVNPYDNTATLLKADLRIITSVEENKETIPARYYLSQNYPNPFNPATVIKYAIPQNSRVMLEVYNALGEKVATLANEAKSAGFYETKFDGSNLSSGTYIYRLTANSLESGEVFVKSGKMLMIK